MTATPAPPSHQEPKYAPATVAVAAGRPARDPPAPPPAARAPPPPTTSEPEVRPRSRGGRGRPAGPRPRRSRQRGGLAHLDLRRQRPGRLRPHRQPHLAGVRADPRCPRGRL